MLWLISGIIFLSFYICVLMIIGYRRGLHEWLPIYLRRRDALSFRRIKAHKSKPLHLMVMVANVLDLHTLGDTAEELKRFFSAYQKRLNDMAGRHVDVDGFSPKHTWFIPLDHTQRDVLQSLSRLCARGFGEVEMFIKETESSNGDRLSAGINTLIRAASEYGMFECCGQSADGKKRSFNILCEKNMHDRDTLTAAVQEGCYADYTMYSADRLSSATVNLLLNYVDVQRKQSDDHNGDRSDRSGKKISERLMRIPGYRGINFYNWREIFYPSIETGRISRTCLPTPLRIRHWIQSALPVPGKPHWYVLKLCVNGCDPGMEEVMLGTYADNLFSTIERICNKGTACNLHYVTGRELYNILSAASITQEDDPAQFRDRGITHYVNHYVTSNTPLLITMVQPDAIVLEIRGSDHCDIYCPVYSMRSFSGYIRSLAYSEVKDNNKITMTIKGKGLVTASGVLRKAPIDVHGARISHLSPVHDGHSIVLTIPVDEIAQVSIHMMK